MLSGIKIYKGLYLGDRSISEDFNFFMDKQISNVVNVTHDVENKFEGKMVQVGNKMKSIQYLRIPVVDARDSNIRHFFEKASEFIKTAKKRKRNTLVHCEMGRSRSVTIIIAFAMIIGKMNLKKVYGHVEKCTRKAEHRIMINEGFKRTLMQFEKDLFQYEDSTLDFFPKIRTQKVYDEKRLFEQYEKEQMQLMQKLEGSEKDELGDFDDYEKKNEDDDFIQEEKKVRDEVDMPISRIDEDELDDEEEIDFEKDEMEERSSQIAKKTDEIGQQEEKEEKEKEKMRDEDEDEDEDEMEEEKSEEKEEEEQDTVLPMKRKLDEITDPQPDVVDGVDLQPPEKKRKLNEETDNVEEQGK